MSERLHEPSPLVDIAAAGRTPSTPPQPRSRPPTWYWPSGPPALPPIKPCSLAAASIRFPAHPNESTALRHPVATAPDAAAAAACTRSFSAAFVTAPLILATVEAVVSRALVMTPVWRSHSWIWGGGGGGRRRGEGGLVLGGWLPLVGACTKPRCASNCGRPAPRRPFPPIAPPRPLPPHPALRRRQPSRQRLHRLLAPAGDAVGGARAGEFERDAQGELLLHLAHLR